MNLLSHVNAWSYNKWQFMKRAILKSIIVDYEYGYEYPMIMILYESNHRVNDCIVGSYKYN